MSWSILSDKLCERENDQKFKLKTLVRSVGANLQTTIHVINCLRIENGWKVRKKTTDFLQNKLCKKSLDCIEKSLDH